MWKNILKKEPDKERHFRDATRREQIRRVRRNVDVDSEGFGYNLSDTDWEERLTEAIEDWGSELDRAELENMEGLPEVMEGLSIDVTFVDDYEGDESLDEEEIFEAGEGHYKIELSTPKGTDIAMCDFTHSGDFSLHDMFYNELNDSDMQNAIKSLESGK